MTTYGRQMIIGLIAGPMIILGLFAWSAAGDRSPASGQSSNDLTTAPAAADTVAPEISSQGSVAPSASESGSGSAASDADGEAEESDAASRPEDDDLRIRPLPQAQGLPDPVSDGPIPVGVQIADIRVNGDVVPVGVENDGAFEVPAVRQVGWYRFGSNAGSPGSTVLAAHISFNGVDGVFRNLEAVASGAEVTVNMDDGSVVDYRIVDVVEYHKTELPVDELFSESGDDRLVLITCGGTFNPRIRSYESNVVAYAEPVTG